MVGFTETVKGQLIVKQNCEIEKKFLVNKLLQIPVIENNECVGSAENEFRLLIQYNSGDEKIIHVVDSEFNRRQATKLNKYIRTAVFPFQVPVSKTLNIFLIASWIRHKYPA